MTENMDTKLDSLDRKIIKILQKNGRISYSELSKMIKKPRTTVLTRVNKLMEKNIIKGFKAKVNPEKLGYKYTAYIMIKAKRTKPIDGKSNQVILAEKLVQESLKNDEIWIEDAHIIMGAYDILIKLRTKSLEAITKFLITKLAEYEDVVHTETILSLYTVCEDLNPI